MDGGVKIAANTAKKGLETAVNKIFEKKKKKPVENDLTLLTE